jgi:1L-myo-inositol 1-phosphate cytidylyltransferase / CDP-L-myo-inositol myo-inositolphosphotransferase
VDVGADEGSRAALTPAPAADPGDGVLVVVPSDLPGVGPDTVVAGLPLLRRIVLAAERARLRPVLIGFDRAAVEGCLAGTSAAVYGSDASAPRSPARRVLFLPVTVIPHSEWLRRLVEMPVQSGHLYADGRWAAVVDAVDSEGLLAIASRAASMEGVLGVLRAQLATEERALDGSGRFAIASLRDLPVAERWLLRSLIKPTEGFMSRHFERRLSLALTRRLCRTRITPNAMTLVSLTVGFACAPFFLSWHPAYQVAGALLFLAHSILDGCDGELARLKFLESRWGAVLDIVGDNLVLAAVFICMALGWSAHTGAAWPVLLGGVAVASTLAIAAIVYRRGMRASTTEAPGSAVSRFADVVIYRDFIYLILLLSTLGKAHWFLALTAAGAPVFLLLLVWLGRRR